VLELANVHEAGLVQALIPQGLGSSDANVREVAEDVGAKNA
jgi:hypothetical protein